MPELTWLAPAWLFGLPVAALLPWLLRRAGHRPRLDAPVTVRYPALSALPESAALTAGWGGRMDLLLIPAAALCILALAQPVRLGPSLPPEPEPVDLVLIVDTSVSMGLRDYVIDGLPVDRLTLARALLDGFAANFSGRRMGLVVLGQPSALWIPLTPDRPLFRRLLARVRLGLAGRYSALGDALALAAERFGGEGERVAVLVTSASAPTGYLSPEAGAERLAAAGIPLYAVVIGSVDNSLSREQTGRLVYAPADPALLDALTRRTGGRMFHAVDATAVSDALQRIESRHRLTRGRPPRLRQALYPWPLGGALVLLALWAAMARGERA